MNTNALMSGFTCLLLEALIKPPAFLMMSRIASWMAFPAARYCVERSMSFCCMAHYFWLSLLYQKPEQCGITDKLTFEATAHGLSMFDMGQFYLYCHYFSKQDRVNNIAQMNEEQILAFWNRFIFHYNGPGHCPYFCIESRINTHKRAKTAHHAYRLPYRNPRSHNYLEAIQIHSCSRCTPRKIPESRVILSPRIAIADRSVKTGLR